ncbi:MULTISPECIES: FAD-dependent monooxygenase [unclassified Bradyrhizobium]|uniref:FAD-dependent monooxygenase n=1 Tax=unclassified Bradyrhizobium TaxID=2631580 RepID=UPI0015CDEAD3|nr:MULTISPECIES: FAD-dependent monooxygenase [unclassified Bradyrhizobium]MBB4259887.1 2-polyprenyl-6-methoxyphenol hydroxylase-like FAD-dependent oxidoreductase [Bradyrhizobium sp. CIR3A]NYG49550.1 2-polyprenyl-6-methoxyphenol hydroxylase-like FAD-dependent oxidoreductase [Bradyrhizobium sp. IAR9]
MSYRPRKALIIGAGIAGPVAAILLRRAGIESAIYEAWPYSKGIGGGLQIAPNGMHVMDEIGLANELISRGSVAEAFDFYSQGGARLGSINRDMQRRFGQPAVNVCRATLNEILIDKAWCACVSLYFEKRLIKIEDRGDQPIIAYFADGTTAEGDFLIGADGVHSIARRQVVPDGPQPFNTGLIGFGGFVPHAVLDGRPIGRHVETTFGQSGFFGYGYCSPDPTDGVMWWSTQPAQGMDAAMFRALDPSTLKQHLRGFHRGWHDPIPDIIEAAENIVVTDTLDVATLPTWSRKRSLLIGDAAHATSPHAGQGASLALEDAMRLARLMQEGQELGATFRAFEAERRPRTEKIVAMARRNGNSKREFSATGAWIRNQMIKLLLPLGSKSMDFMYAYDARAA